MARGEAVRLDVHRAADPVAVAPLLFELAAQGRACRVVGDDIGREEELIPCLTHAVVHVVVLGAAQALVIQADRIVDLAAIGRVGEGIDIARLPAVAEGSRPAAEARGIHRAQDVFPRAMGLTAQHAAADDVLPGLKRGEVLLQKVRRDARVRVQPDDALARRRGQRDVDAGGQPAARVIQQFHLKRCARGEIAHDLLGFVRGRAVNEEKLDTVFRDRLVDHIVNQRAEAALCVVGDDHEADFHHMKHLFGWNGSQGGIVLRADAIGEHAQRKIEEEKLLGDEGADALFGKEEAQLHRLHEAADEQPHRGIDE